MKPVRIVCGTRHSQADFLAKTALGRSLIAHQKLNPVDVCLFPENRRGLSEIYNTAIEQARGNPAILVFIHDDVHLLDFQWSQNLREGLKSFDVIGAAGNTRIVPGHSSWVFINDRLTIDDRSKLSGAVGHGKGFPCRLANYGAAGQRCKLLDGLLLAVDSERLHERGVSFDEQFQFDFYDLDFCRTADEKGLRLGTWPMSVVHESEGAFNTPAWHDAYQRYTRKYATRDAVDTVAV
ncbi:glycosyltransferase [Paraburkholderia phosphatilytica]|uniref:glycosyltransferase n=1 Tax=Paraburkholderia phosphatilytica TaxID=2282883 RepID=UPI000E4D5B19|nr:glycosyltransferase [Paraburkholderia phosphatilytica]